MSQRGAYERGESILRQAASGITIVVALAAVVMGITWLLSAVTAFIW
ncbi:MAG: hypothetical protein R3320_08575 [Nitriliruptorales bacterium]|nr:hypothetical protein [Nitriliruptorales bacterium]